MNPQLILVLIFLFFNYAFSQVKGLVIDNENQPLPFVNVYVENTFVGTTSNEDGMYELDINEPKTYTIVFQHLGYKTIKKKVDIISFPFSLNTTLQKEVISLNEVVINTNENPADRIIKQAINWRKAHLDKIESYKANFYSRGLMRIKDAPKKILGQDIGDFDGSLDSTRTGIIYLSETISKIQYLKPHKLKEKITASKVSGNDNGFSFNNAIDVDYNFYNKTVEFGNNIISPIANNAFTYYRYKLEGVFFDDKGNLVNKIKVIPKRINDPVFSGTIFIVENQWSIYALELSITGTQARIPIIDTLTLKQSFTFSEKDTNWVLISQNMTFKYGILGIKGDGHFIAMYSNYIFNPEHKKKDFNREIVAFEEHANKKDSVFWESERPVPLTAEEIADYSKKDSIQIIRKSKVYLDSIDSKNNKFKMENIIFGYNYSNSYKKWEVGINSPLSTINFNTVQGWNVNLESYYRKNYNDYKRFFSINGTINYGFSDERLRGSLSATYKFNDISRPFLTISGGVVAQQFNPNLSFLKTINTPFSLYAEKNYLKIYDKSFAQISFSNELFNGLRLYSSLAFERRKALFNTTDQTWYPQENRQYTSNNPVDETAFNIAPFKTHSILKLNINSEINFKQNYLSYPESKYNITNEKYPTLYLGYSKGYSYRETDYNYDQIKAKLKQSFNIKNKGKFQYNMVAGKFFNADNIAFMDFYHFNGNQTHIGERTYLNVFNNLPYYSMSTNKSYIEGHIEHDFSGFILGKLPFINKLNFNLILGVHALSVPNIKPYQEYTIGVDNIGWKKFRFLRVDYLRSYQSGFQSDAILFGLKFF